MNNSLLIFLSLGLALISLAISVTALVFANKAKFWKKLFGKEQEPENLEEIIESIAHKIKNLQASEKELFASIDQIGKTLATATQHVAIKRFDSTADDGGNLSFTLAMLDAHQTGIIITSLHGRTHNRIYCKSVVGGTPKQNLSEEEQTVLIDALTKQNHDVSEN